MNLRFQIIDKDAHSFTEAYDLKESRIEDLQERVNEISDGNPYGGNPAYIMAKLSEHIETPEELAVTCYNIGRSFQDQEFKNEKKMMMLAIMSLMKLLKLKAEEIGVELPDLPDLSSMFDSSDSDDDQIGKFKDESNKLGDEDY
jgi:hypothetical protein